MEITLTLIDVQQISASISDKARAFTGTNQFHLEFSFGFNANPEEKHFYLAQTTQVFDKPGGELLGQFTGGVGFRIEQFEAAVPIHNGQFLPVRELLEMLINITYSTNRGLAYQYFRGTGLDRAIFPMMDPKKFMQPLEKE